MAQAIIMKAVVMCSIPFLRQHFILFLIFIIYNLVGLVNFATDQPTDHYKTDQPTDHPTSIPKNSWIQIFFMIIDTPVEEL